MAIIDKLKDLANAFREKTGKSELLQLANMPAEVEAVYAAGLAAGGGALMEVHKITIASDLTSGNNILFSNNDFIKEHYADEGFYFQLISITEHTTGYALGYAYNGNRPLVKVGTYNYCGCQMNLGNGTSMNVKTATGNCTTENWNAVPYVTASGDVRMNNNATNGTVQAGDYILILSVANIEKE